MLFCCLTETVTPFIYKIEAGNVTIVIQRIQGNILGYTVKYGLHSKMALKTKSPLHKANH